MEETALGLQIETPLDFDAAEGAMRVALADEGFGILTEVDVQATLREKIGVEMERYKILGACNPTYANEALQIWRGFGLLMPCSVVIEDVGEHRIVRAFDPRSIGEMHENPALLPLTEKVREGLERALQKVEQAA